MDQAKEQLQQLGFSPYEAQAYVALLQQNPVNGYELAKASGIPRANIYAILQKLEERGAVLRSDTPDGVYYSPVEPNELVARLRDRFEKTLDNAQVALLDVSGCASQERIWSIDGYPAILDHAQSVIESARNQILIAVDPPEAALLSDTMQRAEARGVEVTTLCLSGCPTPCGNCQGKVFRPKSSSNDASPTLVIVADQVEALAGEMRAHDEAIAVRARQKMMVSLASWYVRQHIAFSRILLELGDNYKGLIDPDIIEHLVNREDVNQRVGSNGSKEQEDSTAQN